MATKIGWCWIFEGRYWPHAMRNSCNENGHHEWGPRLYIVLRDTYVEFFDCRTQIFVVGNCRFLAIWKEWFNPHVCRHMLMFVNRKASLVSFQNFSRKKLSAYFSESTKQCSLGLQIVVKYLGKISKVANLIRGQREGI